MSRGNVATWLLFLSLSLLSACAGQTVDTERERLEARAAAVTIIRDDFGVPHIYAKTDADAVFGMLYAQSEDDFNRVERNYIWAIGRLAEIEGEEEIYSDLRARLYMTIDQAKSAYASAPDWLRSLCDAFADGVNYYLYTHPEVQPRLLTRFEPWMPMFFSEGSIGGDIEQVPLEGIKALYGADVQAAAVAGLIDPIQPVGRDATHLDNLCAVFQHSHIDRGRLRDPHRIVGMEVGLLDHAIGKRYLALHCGGEAEIESGL